MAQFINMFDVDLHGKTGPKMLRQMVSEGDSDGNRIGANVYDNGVTVMLGGQCVGKVIRADGATVSLTGTIQGNAAYVVLDQTCCAVEGPIQVAVCWVSGSDVTTLLVAYGTVVNTQTGNAIQPSVPIPDLAQLLAAVADLQDATEAAEDVVNELRTDISNGFISGYYVSTPTPGTAVTAIPLTAHEYYRYQLVDVSAGDVLEITGTVGTAADNVRLWSFWRRESVSSLRLISQSGTSAEASHLRLVAPDDGVFAFTVYPSEPYVLYRETHTELTRKRIITVGKTAGYDYDSIQQAVNAARDYDTILVFPGVYAEHVNCVTKDITIIGTSRDECVLQYSAMNYGTAPLEMARGHLANIVIQGTTQGETTDPNGHAYCLHIEWNQMQNGTLLVENVRFMNAVHHAVGIGMRPYCTIEFRGCQFLATSANSSAFYIHDWENEGSQGDGTDRSMQQIRLIGNSFENYGLNVYTMYFQSEELQEGAALLTAQNNIVTNHVSPDYTVGGRRWPPDRTPLPTPHFLGMGDWVLQAESAENSDEKLNAPKTSAQKTAARAAIDAADAAAEGALSNFAPAFVETTANAAGSYVTYTDGKMYYLPDGHEANVTWANTAKTAVTAGGELSDLKSALDFDEYLINNGTYTIKAADLESGQWSYSTKVSNAARARTQHLLPVRAGMTITYANTTFDTFFGVLETPTSQTYIQTPGWRTDGSGTIGITKGGWLTFVIRNHADTSATVNPSDYNSTVAIITDINANMTLKAFTPSGDTFSVWDMPQASYYNGYPAAFSASISGNIDWKPGATYQVLKVLNRVYLSVPSYNQFYIGQKVTAGTQYWCRVDIGVQGFPINGNIATGTDFDNVTNIGMYFFGGNGETYTHAPYSGNGILLVYKYSANTVAQIGINNAGKQYTRRSSAGVFPSTWYTDEKGFPVRGKVPNNADIDTITDSGIWLLESSYTYTHSPFPHNNGGTLLVYKYSSNTITQIASIASTGLLYIRTSRLGVFPTEWGRGGITNNYYSEHYENTYEITCTPTITSDTNNYLASTGDTTDRTGAIQTMLNSTGVCHLGPGDFYITGIDIPNFSMLTGSGFNTRLILAASVTTGYAVRLGNQCSVKDLQIAGSTSPITVSSTVGTRHGILFEGTAVDSDSAQSTRRYRDSIENVLIHDFEGGAITCDSTGGQVGSNIVATDIHIYRCNAGINVALYSEFHRFTNVSATGCYYGCICNGGNCNYSNCNFSGNTMGLLIEKRETSAHISNNSHGTFSACTFCHSGSNTGIAIKVDEAEAGEIFTGCQIFFGSIVITNSVGIRFVGCNLGRQTPLKIKDSTVVTFDQCTMYDAYSSVPTQDSTGNTAFVFSGCYTRAGAVFDPVS